MSRFVIPISEQKRQRELLWARIYIALSILGLAMLVYYLFVEVDTMRKVFYICLTINFGWSGYETLQKTKRREFFLEIDEEELRWQMHRTGSPVHIRWDDIRWIKNEKNKTVFIFLASSFSAGFLLDMFQEADRTQILQLLEQFANQRQIRLINFSEPVLATA